MSTPSFNCLSFNGADDYLDCGKLDLTGFLDGEYTIELWFYTAVFSNAYLLSASINSTPQIHMGLLKREEDGQPYCALDFDSCDKVYANQHREVAIGKWCHWAFVYRDTKEAESAYSENYVNGEFFTHLSLEIDAMTFKKQIHDLVIGCKAKGSAHFNGKIAEVRVWKKVRTVQEIKDTKDRQLTGTEADLVAYWPCNANDADETSVKDKAGKADATIYGATWQFDDALKLSPATVAVETDHFTPLLTGLADDDWRRQVITDAKNATSDGTLKIKDDTFSGFSLLKTVTDTLFDALNITDVKVELVNATDIENAEEDDGADKKPATVGKGKTKRPDPPGKRFPIKKGGGVQISGTIDILGLKSAEITVEFTINEKKEKDALIKVKIADSEEGKEISEILGGSLPEAVKDVLSVLDKAQLFNPAFAFSTSATYDPEDPFEVGIGEGFNFYGSLKLSDFKTETQPEAETETQSKTETAPAKGGLGEMLGFVADIFKIEDITARFCIRKSDMGGLHFELDAIIEQDLTIIDGKNLKIVYRGMVIGLSFGGNPPEPKLSLESTIELTLKLVGADKLRLTGAIELEPESLGGSFTLEAPIDEETGDPRPWHPFELSQISVNAMAIELGGTYIKPWIDRFGFAVKDLTIGDVTSSVSFKLDTNDYDNFVFEIDTSRITFLELGSTFTPATFIAYKALPDAVKDPLENIIDCSITDMHLSIIPYATTIGTLIYDDEGITAKGTLNLWGWTASIKVIISLNELALNAEMDPFSLSINDVELLKVEGAAGDKKPTFNLKLGVDIKNPELLMSLAVTLLGVRNEVKIESNKDNVRFILSNRSDFGGFTLQSSLDRSKFDSSGSFDFHLKEKISLPVLGDINLDVGVDFELIVKIDQDFFLSLKGQLQFAGTQANIDYELKEALPEFKDLPEKFIEYLKDNAEKIFGALLKTLEEWADAVKSGAISFGGNVAQVAKDGFKMGEDAVGEIINVSKKLDETAGQIASGIKEMYGWQADKVATALKTADYAVDGVTTALKEAGYAIDEVTDALDYGLKIGETEIRGALQKADYAIDSIEDALKPLNPVNWLAGPAASVVESISNWDPFDW